ncbi:hypothetical protein M0812_22881 [Anaeramoeba flamelloides]|uniref:Uncharacterized protein n=1 Tax=Anaeramoeba flamelloides TaxID=1746091 RepID=A0AAV7YJ59_9EUKA|nr:hypothetical protein M0812_22881 [Anaeramoeba flamelloides]
MSQATNPNQLGIYLKKLKIIRSMRERLIIFLKIYPSSIRGLEISHLTKTNTAKTFKGKLAKPKEIAFSKSVTELFAKLTNMSRRSLERGLSSFFFRNFQLVTVNPYSRDGHIYGKIRNTNKKKKIVTFKSNKKNCNPKLKNNNFASKKNSLTQDNQVQSRKRQPDFFAKPTQKRRLEYPDLLLLCNVSCIFRKNLLNKDLTNPNTQVDHSNVNLKQLLMKNHL